MAKNINQLTVASTMNDSDKLYKGLSPYGTTDDRAVLFSTMRNAGNTRDPVADITALKAVSVSGLSSGILCRVKATNQAYFWDATSTVTADDINYVAPNTGTGKWVVLAPQNKASAIYTTGALPVPLPRQFSVNGGGDFTFPALTSANGFQAGDVIWVLNVWGASAQLKYSDGTSLMPAMEPGQLFIIKVNALGTPGTLSIYKIFGNITEQQANAIMLTGGTASGLTIDSSSIGQTTPAAGAFTALKQLIGGFFGIFTHANTADRTYTLQNRSGTIADLTDIHFLQPVADLTALKAIDISTLPKGTGVYVNSLKNDYFWDPDSTISSIAGYCYIPPDTGSGNWIVNRDQNFVSNAFNSSGIAQIQLPTPLPRICQLNTMGANLGYLLPELTFNNGFGIGDFVFFYNVGDTDTKIIYADGLTDAIDVQPGQFIICQILSGVSGLGAIFAIYSWDTLSLQNASSINVTGGDINNTVIGNSTAAAGTFSALSEKIGGFLGSFTHANTANRTYTLPDNSGVIPLLQVNPQSGTTYTITPADANNILTFSNAGTTTVTIDTNANQPIPLGAIIRFKNIGGSAALLTLSPAGGVTLNFNTNVTVGNNGIMAIEKIATNTWDVIQLYEEYTHTTTWQNIWASPVSGNLLLVRNMRNINITFPVVTATANNGTSIGMTTSLPARFRPGTAFELRPLEVSNNSVTGEGSGTLNTSGNMTIFNGQYGSFTGSGVGGFFAQAALYSI